MLLSDPKTEAGVVMRANADALEALRLPVTVQEQSLVDKTLHNLHMAYVEVVSAPPAPADESTEAK